MEHLSELQASISVVTLMNNTLPDDVATILRRRIRASDTTQQKLGVGLGYSASWVGQQLLGDPAKTIRQLIVYSPASAEKLARELGWGSIRQMADELGIFLESSLGTAQAANVKTSKTGVGLSHLKSLHNTILDVSRDETFVYTPSNSDCYAEGSVPDHYVQTFMQMKAIVAICKHVSQAIHFIYATPDRTVVIIAQHDITQFQAVTYRTPPERDNGNAPHYIAGRELEFVASITAYKSTLDGDL